MLKRFSAGCLMLGLVLPLLGQEGKKKGGKKGADQEPIDAETLKPGTFRGRLINPPGLEGEFVVEIETQYLAPKKGVKPPKNNSAAQVQRLQQQIQKEAALAQSDAARGRNPASHLRRIQQLQIQMQQQLSLAQSTNLSKYYDVKTMSQKVEFHAAAEVKVRLKEPPQVFTDKGDIKKFTPAELQELKGKNRNLPGYEGNLADLKSNQIVRVTQVRPKPSNKKTTSDSDPTKSETKTHKIIVTMILVLGEVPGKDDSIKTSKKDK